MMAVIVANGDLFPGALRDLALDGGARVAPLVIAADGGALKAEAAGLAPQVIVGDADSLSRDAVSRFRAHGAELRILPTDKEQSDTEAALREAVARGADRIVVLGGLGGTRFEHALANVALLALPELEGRDVVLRDGRTAVRLLGTRSGPGHVVIRGVAGDYVSLVPVDDPVEGVGTAGLRFPLALESLRLGPSRGLSNELLDAEAEVSTARGRLLVVNSQFDRRSAEEDPELPFTVSNVRRP